MCFLSAFGQTGGKRQYEFWMMCMFIALAPVTSIFIFNMLIICEVRTINRKIGSRKGAVGKIKGQKKEAQLTRLLLLVTFTFLILNSFHCIVQCFLMLGVVSQLYNLTHGRIQRGTGVPPPLENHKNMGFLSNAGPDPLKNHKAAKPAFNVGPSSARQRNAITFCVSLAGL